VFATVVFTAAVVAVKITVIVVVSVAVAVAVAVVVVVAVVMIWPENRMKQRMRFNKLHYLSEQPFHRERSIKVLT
jgi:hypothetical protein